MNPRDIDFLRSGTGNGTYNEGLSDDDVMGLTSVVVTFMEDAMRVAASVVRAQSRTEITPRDTIVALKLTALPSYSDDGTVSTYFTRHPDWQERAATHAERLQEMGSSDEDYDDDIIDDAVHDDSVCAELDGVIDYAAIESRWLSWNPTVDLDKILKNAVDNTAAKFIM